MYLMYVLLLFIYFKLLTDFLEMDAVSIILFNKLNKTFAYIVLRHKSYVNTNSCFIVF